jgi:hypothetical protein
LVSRLPRCRAAAPPRRPVRPASARGAATCASSDRLLLSGPSAEIAQRVPSLKRQCSDCAQSLDKHTRHIVNAQTKLAYLVSLRESGAPRLWRARA